MFVFLRLEQDKSSEAGEAIRNLVLMVASLCMCGYTELRPSPASNGSLFKMMGFTLPQPQGRGAYLGKTIMYFYHTSRSVVPHSGWTFCGITK